MREDGLDLEAFDKLFDEHAPDIYRYLARRLGVDSAGDLTAEVFRIAIERRATFDPKRNGVRPWLYGIAANLIRTHYRREERHRRAMRRVAWQANSAPTDFEASEDRLMAKHHLPQVLAVIDELAPDDRETLILSVWENLSNGEVADALGIPEGTVKSRLNRIRRKIRERLDDSGQQIDVPRSLSLRSIQ